MLVIQRPTVEAHRRGEGQPAAVRRRPARARLRPHARQLAAPHPAVVHPRRRRHPGPLRRRAARVRHHRRCHRGRHRHHPQPQGPRPAGPHRRAGHPAPRRARPGRGHRRPTSPSPPTSRSSTPTCTSPPLNGTGRLAIDITVQKGRGYVSADRNKHVDHHRRHPRRLDLLAGAPGRLHGRAHPRRAVHRLRPPRARHRDRRLHLAPRGARLGRRHAALAGAARRGDERRAPGPRARRGQRHHRRLARPRPAHRGPRPLRASPQLPQAGPGQHASASSSRRPRTTCWPSPTSARSRSTRSSPSSTSAACRCAPATDATDASRPKEPEPPCRHSQEGPPLRRQRRPPAAA